MNAFQSVVKNSVGRPRPDLLSRCKPRAGTPEHELVTIEVCTEVQHRMLHDGWRSFPSGHSSFAFSGLGYLALFLAGQMHIFRPGADLFRVLWALFPLIGAALIAISRCEDYRHDVYDVTIGSILGGLVAFFSYRRYYPRLSHPRCSSPYLSRADASNAKGFERIHDEEEGAAERQGGFTIEDPEEDDEAVGMQDLGGKRNVDRDVEMSMR